MSVLEFISSVTWPITVLLLVTVGYVIIKRDKGLRAFIKHVISNRDMRMSAPGLDIEFTRAESAAELAAQPDEQLLQVVSDSGAAVGINDGSIEPRDATLLRREAVEEVLREAAELGWHFAKTTNGGPPELAIRWDEDGRPDVVYDMGATMQKPPVTPVSPMDRLLQRMGRMNRSTE